MKHPQVGSILWDGLQIGECSESPYDGVGEEQVEAGGGSAERLVLVEGEARQQPLPFVSSFLVSPEVTFGGHGIAVVCQVASGGMGRGGDRRPGSEV